jgi:predicted transcriptional regulator
MDVIFRENFNKSLSSFISTLSQKEISEKYSYYYIILYVELQGIKGQISYDKLAILWRVEKNSIKNILVILDKKGLILRTREQGNRIHGRYFYLFIIPLVHPDFEDVTFS